MHRTIAESPTARSLTAPHLTAGLAELHQRTVRVLVAEDDSAARLLLEALLKKSGYEVVSAADGELAWEIMSSDDAPQFAILDWMMPGMDGIEVCRRFRQLKPDDPTYIILLTTKGAQEDVVEGLQAGADDYVTKPFHREELCARIQVGRRVVELQSALADRVAELQETHQRIKQDLEAASVIQHSLLPSQELSLRQLECSWIFSACDMVGGDMFNIFRLDENNVGVYVLDVSGHGVQAALLSVNLSRVLTPFPQQGGILKRSVTPPPHYEIVSPVEVVEQLNKHFPVMNQSHQFFSLLYGVIDLSRRTFRYIRAGHPGPILLSEGLASAYLEPGNPPIGIIEDVPYQEGTLQLKQGDQLILYTDGIEESKNSAGEMFGLENMLSIIASQGQGHVRQTVRSLCASAEEFRAGLPQHDDLIVVGMQVQ